MRAGMSTSWKRGLRSKRGESRLKPILGCRRGGGQGLLLPKWEQGNREMGRKMSPESSRKAWRIKVWPHSTQCPETRASGQVP